MSTSDINYKKQSLIYGMLSGVCLLFSIIYEAFSHNVYSIYMIGVFVIPLVLGTFTSLILFKRQSVFENNLYNAGVATLTFGSILKGVLDIYGTTNSKLIFYLIVGVICIVLSLLLSLIRKINFKNIDF